MFIVVGVVVGDAGDFGVDIGAPQIFGADDFASGGFHQRRAREENRALISNDDGFIAHRRNISAACGAGAHDAGDLRNASGAHVCLVEEDAAEMFAVREYLCLIGQVRAAAIDQIDAG